MKANNQRIDYILTAFYSCLALYGAGVGISNIPLALMLMGLCIVGSAVSYLIVSKDKTGKIGSVSGIAYALSAAAVIFFIVPLNSLLPGGGFPKELIVASVMCWFITLGAFLAWNENVLLFQAIPSLSLLSMVGIWETYNGAVLSFVIFLLSITVLLSRAHTRSMYRLAQESGYTKLGAITGGPWKRMAGPEWVLGFAAVVIVLSSISAPFIQNAFKPFAGNFRQSLPKSLAKNLNQMDSTVPTSTVQTSVGTGPHTPGDRIMLLAQLDQPRYLKDGFFELYTGSGWQKDPNASFPNDRVWMDGDLIYRKVFSQKVLKNPEIIGYSIIPVSATINRVPVPGDAFELRMQTDGKDSRFKNGVLGTKNLSIYFGKSYVPNSGSRPVNKVSIKESILRDALTMVSTTDRVRDFTESIVKGRKTDYYKALAIKEAIETRASYNLKAAAVPANMDAVDYFLFNSKEGYCDLFATSMVVMARCAGIPARYVTGYYPIKDEKDGIGRTVLRSSDKHAWAELFFQDVGWIPFDATEGALEIDGNERGGTGVHIPWYESPLFQKAMNGALVLAVCSLLYFAFSDKVRLNAIFAKSLANRPGLDRAAQVRKLLGVQYSLLAKSMARSTGIQRPIHMSPTEYADRTNPSLGKLGSSVVALTNRYVVALYSNNSISDSEIDTLKQDTKRLRSELRRIRPEGAPHPVLGVATKPIASAIGLVKTIFHLKAEDKKERLSG